ncbi:MAG: hypothetical protein GXP32_07630 [Kiritimatiellaeota bacterium]|nr:hypothetical protein [Kiritimatiellota bacterium]
MIVVCVVNPKASDGACLKRWPFIESLFVRAGMKCRLVSREGDLRGIAFDALAEIADSGCPGDAVLAAVGGDGTQHAIMNGIARFRKERPDADIPPYVPIPMGTGNNIAKSLFEIPFFSDKNGGVEAAVAIIANGVEREIDLGLVATEKNAAGVCFLDAFSIGADAAILADKDAASAKLAANHPLIMSIVKGYPLYAWHGLKTLCSMKSVECEVLVDGEPWYAGPLFNMVVNDTAIYGGEFDLTLSSFPDDGKLDALIFTSPADYLRKYLLGYRRLPRAARHVGSLPNGQLALRRGESFKVTLSGDLAAQVDGEPMEPGRRFEITALPGALKILAEKQGPRLTSDAT